MNYENVWLTYYNNAYLVSKFDLFFLLRVMVPKLADIQLYSNKFTMT